MAPIRYFHLLIISSALLFLLSGQDEPDVEYDVLLLEGSPIEKTPLLVDGPDYTPNDFAVSTSDLPALIGPYGSGEGEVVVFPPHPAGALRVVPVSWTGESDTVQLRPSPRISVPVTFWIVTTPDMSESEAVREARLSAMNAYFAANSILIHEHAGITLCSLTINVRTVDPASPLLDVVCSIRGAPETIRQNFRDLVGREAGRLNIYLVPLVESEPSRGHTCEGTDYVFLGHEAGITLLAHEFGHILGLAHIDPITGFDQTNVMHGASDSRRFLTEGQIFRAHVSDLSSVNLIPDGATSPWREQEYTGRSVWGVEQSDRACELARRLRDDEPFDIPATISSLQINEHVVELVRRMNGDSLVRLLRPRTPSEINWRWGRPGTFDPPGPPPAAVRGYRQ